MNPKNWLPFLRWWPLVNRANTRADIIAGITGAIVVLPQGVAFATIAGMPPQYGLYAGMIPAIIAALFGSSWHLVSGPTTAASVVLFSALSPLAEPGSAEYVQIAITLTLMVGIFQLALGLARMGALVNLISHTVIVGFTAGAALLIIISQLRHFFGLDVPRSTDAYMVIWQVISNIHHTNPYALVVSASTLLVAIVVKVKFKRIPYMLIAMAVGSLVAWYINRFSEDGVHLVHTVESLPAMLPPLSLPTISFDMLETLAPAAFAITLLALTEAISIARSLALRSGQNLDANQEFVGQGLSNMVGSFVSGYVATGSFNRSAINYESGAKTPLAAIFAAVLLMIIVLLVAPLSAYLPHAAMAGVLMIVGWGLIDRYHIKKILTTSRSETSILAITFLSTLLIGLEFAILFGVLMGLFLFLMNTMRPRLFSRVPDKTRGGTFHTTPGMDECPQLKILRIDGSIYFGSIYYIKKILSRFRKRAPEQSHLLLLCHSINHIDISGAEFLAEEALEREKTGGQLYLYRLKDGLREQLRKGEYLDNLPDDNFYQTKQHAIATIFDKLDHNICARCDKRIFHECAKFPAQKDTTSPTD